MQSQRELFERQIALERAEMEAMPEEEEAELAASYRAKGFARRRGRARSPTASSRTRRPRSTCSSARSSGSTPTSSGRRGGPRPGRSSPSPSAPSIPVIPYLFGGGTAVLLVSLGLSLIALFAVGAGVSLLTGRGLLFSGFRQLGIGLAAALVTYAIGSLIGVSTRGLIGWPDDDRAAAARRGLDPGRLVERTGRPLRRARARLRQGHRRRAGLDPVRAPGDRGRRSISRPATGSSCRPGPPTTRSSGRTGVTCLEAHLPPGTLDAAATRRGSGRHGARHRIGSRAEPSRRTYP